MRWTLIVTGLLLAAPQAWGQDEAQKLYEGMQQKLAKAKAQQVEFAADAKIEVDITAKGTLTLAAGNRFQLTFQLKEDKQQTNGTWVSDGRTMLVVDERNGKVYEGKQPVPANRVEEATGLLNQGSVLLAVLHLAEKLGPPGKGFAVKASGFKMLAKEKVGDRAAAVIEYQLSIDGTGKDSATCKVWIDPQSQLPLKRTVKLLIDGKLEFSSTETYARWELDPPLPDKLFTLPK